MTKSVHKNKKIVVGMSGGVDSSVALILLKKQGWDPVGVSLKYPVWEDKQNLLKENICCSKESFAIAGEICQVLGVPHYVYDVSKDFKKEVVDYFTSEFKDKRTPNPCVICNRHLKFDKLFSWAKAHGIKYVATGHYARTGKNERTGKYELLKSKDKEKDQTYSLCFLPQRWLGRVVFPLGDYNKKEVYDLAKKEGLGFFEKRKQSQDFCFVAGKSLPCFLEKEVGLQPGEIKDEKGNVLGRHRGLHFYTIGQRKGISLSGGPYFVKEFDISKNALVVTKNQRKIFEKEIILSPFHFISGEAPKRKTPVMAKVRYRQKSSRAAIFPPQGKKMKIVFEKSQRAVTPGQFCVFYKGEVCLGGGIIN